jgi:hypothetical protein
MARATTQRCPPTTASTGLMQQRWGIGATPEAVMALVMKSLSKKLIVSNKM